MLVSLTRVAGQRLGSWTGADNATLRHPKLMNNYDFKTWWRKKVGKRSLSVGGPFPVPNRSWRGSYQVSNKRHQERKWKTV